MVNKSDLKIVNNLSSLYSFINNVLYEAIGIVVIINSIGDGMIMKVFRMLTRKLCLPKIEEDGEAEIGGMLPLEGGFEACVSVEAILAYQEGRRRKTYLVSFSGDGSRLLLHSRVDGRGRFRKCRFWRTRAAAL